MEVSAEQANVGGALLALGTTHPDLVRQLVHENGHLRPDRVLFVNDRDVRFLRGLDTPLAENDELTIMTPQPV